MARDADPSTVVGVAVVHPVWPRSFADCDGDGIGDLGGGRLAPGRARLQQPVPGRLIELRHTEPAVVDGDVRMLLADHEQVYAFTRRLDDVELLVLANFCDEPVTVTVADGARRQDRELLLVNVPEPKAIGTQLTLQAWEARVHHRAVGAVCADGPRRVRSRRRVARPLRFALGPSAGCRA